MSQMKWCDEDGITLLEKGKRGFFKVIFGRTMIILLILVAQFLLLFSFIYFLSSYIPALFAAITLLDIIMVVYLLNCKDNPAIKLSWVILIVISPVLGAILYLFVHMEIGHRAVHKALQHLEKETEPYIKKQPKLMEKIKEEDPILFNMAEYLKRHGDFPVFEHTKVIYFPSGADKFEEMIKQLEEAKSFIFMEYFILKEGYMWGRILNILERKVKEGVEVRVMYDGMCSLMLLPANYAERLQKLGIKSRMFAPIMPFISTHYNNRDHRKILVIDGRVAFTGGINLADEYIGRTKRFGDWKDTAVMVEGEAVSSFTLMFLQMWNAEKVLARLRKAGITRASDTYEKYMNVESARHLEEAGYVIPYGDSPLDEERVGEMVYMDIINRAVCYVHIMTPYLILDHEMLTALVYAAKRGVEVKLILPHIPDKKYAFYLAKTHYYDLTAAGVQIYEYTPGFVHAKVFTADDYRAVVGTINLDYRSLYLHFECATYLHKVPQISEIERDFQETLEKCHKVTLEDIKKEKALVKLAGGILKLVAPLM